MVVVWTNKRCAGEVDGEQSEPRTSEKTRQLNDGENKPDPAKPEIKVRTEERRALVLVVVVVRVSLVVVELTEVVVEEIEVVVLDRVVLVLEIVVVVDVTDVVVDDAVVVVCAKQCAEGSKRESESDGGW